MLLDAIKGLFNPQSPAQEPAAPGNAADVSQPCVLNVGGNTKSIAIPNHYQNWRHLLLDISPSEDADIVMDARKLADLPPQQFDAIYCSHNLEHYYQHEVKTVLAGFLHVLKPDGFVEIHVPDMRSVLKQYVESGMEINDTLYVSANGPITVHDIIYGWGKEIEESGEDFYAHKTGFTETSLRSALTLAGFGEVWIAESKGDFAIAALAFKHTSTPTQRTLLGLPN